MKLVGIKTEKKGEWTVVRPIYEFLACARCGNLAENAPTCQYCGCAYKIMTQR